MGKVRLVVIYVIISLVTIHSSYAQDLVPQLYIKKRIDSLVQLANQYAVRDIAKSYEYANEALSQAREESIKTSESDALALIARAYRGLADYEQSQYYYTRAIEIAESLNDKKRLGKLYGDLSYTVSYTGNIQKAQELLEKAIKIASEMSEPPLEALQQLGYLFTLKREYGKSFQEYEKAYNISVDTRDTAYTNNLLNNMATMAMLDKREGEAFKLYKKAYKLEKMVNDRKGLIFSLAGLSHLMMMNEKYDSVKIYLDEAYIMSKELNEFSMHVRILDRYKKLNVQKGNFKRLLKYTKEYELLIDTIYNSEKITDERLVQSKLQVVNHQNQLNLLKEKNKQRSVKADNRKMGYLWFSVLLALIVFGFGVIYKLRKKYAAFVQLANQKKLADDRSLQPIKTNKTSVEKSTTHLIPILGEIKPLKKKMSEIKNQLNLLKVKTRHKRDLDEVLTISSEIAKLEGQLKKIALNKFFQ